MPITVRYGVMEYNPQVPALTEVVRWTDGIGRT
jgi:hypothetical protein